MATKANLVIDQGTDYSTVVNVTDDDDNPINLTGYTGRGQIRKHYTSSNAVSFSVSVSNAELGQLTLALTATQTSNMAASRYVYDVEVVSSANIVSRIIEGIVTITPEVTR